MTDDIRLNQAKRKAIKDAWKDTIWKKVILWCLKNIHQQLL